MGWLQNLFGNKSYFDGGEKQFLYTGTGFSFTQMEIKEILRSGYLSNPDVYSIVKRISDVGSYIPLRVYKKNKTEWVEVENSDIEKLLRKPNQKQTTQEFIEECLVQLLNTGNVYIRKNKAIGFKVPTSMSVMPSGMIEIETNSDWSVKRFIYSGATEEKLDPEEVIHIKYIDPTSNGVECHYGLSPLQAAFLTLDGSNNSHQASAFILRNKGISGLITTDSGDVVVAPGVGKAIQKQIQRQIAGTDNYGKVPFSSVPLKYVQTGMSPTDLKMLELNTQRLRTFCNVYGVDSSIFNDPENKTYSNRTEASKDFYSLGVLPPLDKILTGINKDLIKDENTAIKADTSEIAALQKDKKLEAEINVMYVSAGIIDANEIREELGYEARQNQGQGSQGENQV